MSLEEWLSTLTVFAKLFASKWTEIKRFTTPDLHFFSIVFGTQVTNPAAPGGLSRYTVEGGLWAGTTGFELVAHRSIKNPAREGEYMRQHVIYEAFAGAGDRKAVFESLDTMDKMKTVFKARPKTGRQG